MSTTTELIKDYYYQDNIDYAYLLNGTWGVGKTYYVRNSLRNVDSLSGKIIYVSLFNVSNWLEIIAKMYHELYSPLSKINNFFHPIISNLPEGKLKKTCGLFSELVKPFLEDTIVNLLKDKLVVFDDLERTQISVELLMGNISDVLLSKNIHVLIVGDDSHLNDERKEVFIKWKEKIIRRTLSINDRYEDALVNILQNRKKPSSTSLNYYNNNREDFIKIIHNVKIYNLRTWKFAFDLFDELFNKYKVDYFYYFEVFKLIVLSVHYSNEKESKTFRDFLREKDLEVDAMQWSSEFRKRYDLEQRIPYVQSLISFIKGEIIDVNLVRNDILKIYPYFHGLAFINASLISCDDIEKEEMKNLLDDGIKILNSGVSLDIKDLIKLHNNIEFLLDLGYGEIFNSIGIIHDKCIELLKQGNFIGELDDYNLEKIKNNKELNFIIEVINKKKNNFIFNKLLDYNNLNAFIEDSKYDKSSFINDLKYNEDEIYKVLTNLNHSQAWMFYYFIQTYCSQDGLTKESINQLKKVVNKVLENVAVDEYIKIPIKNIIKYIDSFFPFD